MSLNKVCLQTLKKLIFPFLWLFLMSSLAAVGQNDEGNKANHLKAIPADVSESGLIRLESTFVGDKEQPSVSYFIPWQGTGSPDGLKWQIERLNDDSLSLVDRDIMLRSMNIYKEMNLE
jgi:hypothetical protein